MRPDRPASAEEVGARTRRHIAGLEVAAALEELRTSLEGLTPEEAAARLRHVGENRLPAPRRGSLARQFAAQFTHFFALTLWVAALLAYLAGMPQLGLAIVIVIAVNGLFAFIQEVRAERATRALAALLPDRAVVRRGGHRMAVPAAELVPGDLLLLEEGARICADARVVRSVVLKVDHSALTGESEPLPRGERADRGAHDDLAAEDLVFAGGFVVSGSGLAVVAVTGARTRLGAISALSGGVSRRPTPLHASLNRAVRIIGACAIAAALLFLAVSLALGMPLRMGLLFAVGVMVALVPEGLLPTVTLSLALGAWRMARRGTLARNLEAVETLGQTTLICTDKTGTLTANQMTVTALWVAGRTLDVSGAGYGPSGTLFEGGRPLRSDEREALFALARAAALCGDARVEPQGPRWRCLGDPVDGALLVLARKAGVERDEAARHAPRVREFPFESARRRMTTVHALATGERLVLCKGSPEAVLPLCTRWASAQGEGTLDAAGRGEVAAATEALAARGLRVLALAERVADGQLTENPADAEQGLTFLGLAAMADPIRPEVPAAVQRCREAGIRVLMITGDHPATAAAVASRIGLDPGALLCGDELPSDEAALEARLRRVDVLARVAPEQKLAIAKALQSAGEVVAMTGDGVNDAPALRQADIGVAMGASGTDVAREAADLVLLDDNFTHIVEAVEEGRAVFDNIRRFLTYHLTDNVAELAPFVAWALSGGAFPLFIGVLQVLALDIGTDLLPALALGAEPPDEGVMRQAPRRRAAPLLDARLLGRAFLFLGVVEAALSLSMVPLGAGLFLGSAGSLPSTGPSHALLSTCVFASIVLMQVANAFECRSSSDSAFSPRPRNRLLLGAVAIELVLLTLFVQAAPVAGVLGNRPLTGAQWAVLLVCPGAFVIAEESRKALVRALRRGRRAPASRRPWLARPA